MRKLVLLMLALALAALPLSATAQEAALDGNLDAATGEYIDPMSDPAEGGAQDVSAHAASSRTLTDESALEAAQNASKLYELIARGFQLDVGAAGFDGAPDAETAWAFLYEALEQGAVEGMDEEGAVSPDGVTRAYDMVFAYGTIPAQPEDFSLLQRDGDVYRRTSDPGDASYPCSVLGVMVAEGAIQAEVAAMIQGPDVPADLTALFSATLLPDDESPFGVKLAGLLLVTDAPAMTGAEATQTLADYKGITYAAANALDGDPATCWAYSEEKQPGAVLTLSADEPQTARGIRLTPAYAKTGRVAMTNNRVKAFRVELSDGASFDFTVEPDATEDFFGSFASFAFDRAHEITWASVQVTEVYPGEKYADTCISEIALF